MGYINEKCIQSKTSNELFDSVWPWDIRAPTPHQFIGTSFAINSDHCNDPNGNTHCISMNIRELFLSLRTAVKLPIAISVYANCLDSGAVEFCEENLKYSSLQHLLGLYKS